MRKHARRKAAHANSQFDSSNPHQPHCRCCKVRRMKKKATTKSAARKPAAKKPAGQRQAKTYTPKPLQGNGRAPFRYPPQ
jgi:hypothetical protein